MKNVIVFALGGERYAMELRWVREVVTLGFVTRVPGAPAAICGVFNRRGQITPVLDLPALLGSGRTQRAVVQGDGAVLIEVEGVVAALVFDNVDQVSSLREAAAEGGDRLVVDGRGREIPIIDPPDLIEQVTAKAHKIEGARLEGSDADGA